MQARSESNQRHRFTDLTIQKLTHNVKHYCGGLPNGAPETSYEGESQSRPTNFSRLRSYVHTANRIGRVEPALLVVVNLRKHDIQNMDSKSKVRIGYGKF